jgi:hypothetical protein
MNLYIFNDTCSGAMYGIGTYIRELTISLKDSNINICLINLFSDMPQIIIEEKTNIKYWYFPKPIQEQRTTSKKSSGNYIIAMSYVYFNYILKIKKM